MAKSKKKGEGPEISLDKFHPPSGYKPGDGHHHHKKSFSSTREAIHRGHKIKVKTTYRIEIAGEPLTMHTAVTNDGRVHYHGLPNYAFKSAIDMAKKIVDASKSVRIVEDELNGSDHGGGHGSDDDHHDHGDQGNHGGHH